MIMTRQRTTLIQAEPLMAQQWHGDLAGRDPAGPPLSAQRAPILLIIPSAVDPPVRGVSQVRAVKVEHPTG